MGKLPTPDEVLKLVNDKLITKDEAREILFNEEEVKVYENGRNIESLESEIKFLKEVIEKLGDRTKIIETIRYIEKPYNTYSWIQPYMVYCGTSNGVYTASGNGMTAVSNNLKDQVQCSFSAIQTY